MEGTGFDSRRGSDNFSSSQVQTSADTHQDTYPMGTSGSLQTIKRPERETTHLPLVTRISMRGAMPPFAHTSSWCDA
jgi:hypothetical protein